LRSSLFEGGAFDLLSRLDAEEDVSSQRGGCFLFTTKTVRFVHRTFGAKRVSHPVNCFHILANSLDLMRLFSRLPKPQAVPAAMIAPWSLRDSS
jgi:hypothetical protein